MTPPPSNRAAFATAIGRFGRLIVAAGAVLVMAEVAAALVIHAPSVSTIIAVVVTMCVLAVQWGSLAGAARSRSKASAWVVGAYPVQILVIAVGLYVPRILGIDVRFAAMWAVIALVAAIVCEIGVLATTRHFSVDAPSADEM